MEIARQYSDALKAISESLQGTVCLKRKPLSKAKTKTEAFRERQAAGRQRALDAF